MSRPRKRTCITLVYLNSKSSKSWGENTPLLPKVLFLIIPFVPEKELSFSRNVVHPYSVNILNSLNLVPGLFAWLFKMSEGRAAWGRVAELLAVSWIYKYTQVRGIVRNLSRGAYIFFLSRGGTSPFGGLRTPWNP